MHETVIYKYEITLQDLVQLYLPLSAKILSLQMQKSKLQMWAEVDPEEPIREVRTLRIIGTGHRITHLEGYESEFITTFQMNGGDLVFHVFEVKET